MFSRQRRRMHICVGLALQRREPGIRALRSCRRSQPLLWFGSSTRQPCLTAWLQAALTARLHQRSINRRVVEVSAAATTTWARARSGSDVRARLTTTDPRRTFRRLYRFRRGLGSFTIPRVRHRKGTSFGSAAGAISALCGQPLRSAVSPTNQDKFLIVSDTDCALSRDQILHFCETLLP